MKKLLKVITIAMKLFIYLHKLKLIAKFVQPLNPFFCLIQFIYLQFFSLLKTMYYVLFYP